MVVMVGAAYSASNPVNRLWPLTVEIASTYVGRLPIYNGSYDVKEQSGSTGIIMTDLVLRVACFV